MAEKEKRAEHGELVIPLLAQELTTEFGSGFSRQNLFRMTRFAERFPAREIVSTLSRQLGWSHFVEIIVPSRRGFGPIGDARRGASPRFCSTRLVRVKLWVK